MNQPWIHSPKIDTIYILSPPIIATIVVFLFHRQMLHIEHNHSFLTWLVLIVFIDVAHVYATLFKTYFVAAEFKKHKTRYLLTPILGLLISIGLYSVGSLVFWSVLAYIAVYHFIRQQYGFMRIYARQETKKQWKVLLENTTIYATMLYPMAYWFLSPPRRFSWFMPNEFFVFHHPSCLLYLGYLYVFIVLMYLGYIAKLFYDTKYFNIPKNVLIAGTAISWYVGIVAYNNDLVFTLLNVVTHGIPYMALVYLKEVKQTENKPVWYKHYLQGTIGIAVYVLVLLAIAFSEEFIWDILVWKEQFSFALPNLSKWHIIIVPLLSLPQLTHYILDGFIWKTTKPI